MPEGEVSRAGAIVDAENLFYRESRQDPALAQECLTALIWWSRRAVGAVALTPRDGYAKERDPAYRALHDVAPDVKFDLHPVGFGQDKAELEVIERLEWLTGRGHREFVIGGIDHLVLEYLVTLNGQSTLWIVAPTQYPRRLRSAFTPQGKWAGVRVRAIRWLDDVLADYQTSRVASHLPGEARPGSAPSPFSTAGGFWRPLLPTNGTQISTAAWGRAAAAQFSDAGYAADDANELAWALQTELSRRYGTTLQLHDNPHNRRHWSKVCLSSLFRAYLRSDDLLGPVSDFYYDALGVGSAHIRRCFELVD